MTTNQVFSRSEEVRKKKSQSASSKPSIKSRKSSHKSYQSTSNNNTKRKSRSTITRRGVYQPNFKHLDSVSRTSRAKNSSPGIAIPTIGPRLFSAILAVLMGFVWITIWNSNAFMITDTELFGNTRLVDSDISSVLPAIGESIFLSIPENIEKDLIIIFPEIETIKVEVAFPNRISITIKERTPVVTWIHPDGSQNWIDTKGFAFPIRGEAEGLVTIISFGDPPNQTELAVEGQDPSSEIVPTAIPYIQPSQITNILELNKHAPEGALFSYNPKYGLGWKDPQGWSVYFGENTQDVSMKINIYKAIIDKLTQQSIQPSMISVEYLDAPFYRTD